MADTAAQDTEDDVFTFTSAASKEYPLAPEGPHNVTVDRALFAMKVNSFAPAKGEQPMVSLMLLSDQTYTDEETKNAVNYHLFNRMKISDHPKSAMFEFFNSVLGIPVPLNDKKKITLNNKKEIVEGEKEPRIHLPQFEKLKFSVIVKHKKSEDGQKVFDNVDSIFATPEQKVANAALFREAA